MQGSSPCPTTVAVAQLAERQVVILVVVSSTLTGHPTKSRRIMAKLTPQAHVDIPATADSFYYLGPPTEEFIKCEQTFVVHIEEMLWPGHQPYTIEQISKWISMGLNPRTPYMFVVEEAADGVWEPAFPPPNSPPITHVSSTKGADYIALPENPTK